MDNNTKISWGTGKDFIENVIRPQYPENLNADYLRWRNVTSYLESLKVDALKASTRGTILKASGQRNSTRWNRQFDEFPNLFKPVPISLLQILGYNKKLLHDAVTSDVEAFQRVITLPRFAEYFTVRWMATIYQKTPLGRIMTEDEAVTFVQQFCVAKQKRCCIVFPQLGTIYIETPDGTVDRSLFLVKPSIRITKTSIHFSMPDKPGIVRIGNSILPQ